MKGSYSLIIRTPEKMEIGALGVKRFEMNYAVYNGSAFGPGGLKRVLRHFSSDKKIHWHIDHLLSNSEIEAALIFPGKDLECELSRKMENEVKGFGSSDCSCSSHLYQFGSFSEAFYKISGLVSEVKIMDRDRYNKYKNAESEEAYEKVFQDLPDADTYKQSREL